MEDKLDLILKRLDVIDEKIKELDDDIIENQTLSKQFWFNMLANLTADAIFTSIPYNNLKNSLGGNLYNNVNNK